MITLNYCYKKIQFIRSLALLLPSFLLCFLHQVDDTHGITIETTRSLEPINYDCDKIKFHEGTFITCACLEGVWGFLLKNPGQSSQWKVIGGKNKKENQCFQVDQWVSQVRRISKDVTKSSLTKLKENSNKFLVTNEGSWEAHLIPYYNGSSGQRVIEDEKKQQRICLPGGGKNRYCIYSLKTKDVTLQPLSSKKSKGGDQSEKESLVKKSSKPIFPPNKIHPAKLWNQLQEKSFTPSKTCSPDSVKMKPLYCEDFELEIVDDELFVCSLISGEGRSGRVKRAAPTPRNVPMSGPELDEDFVSPETEKLFRGNKRMMNAIADYVRLAVAKILEISTGRAKRGANKVSPVQNLLRLTNDIMKRTCSIVNDDTFTIALESFLKLQKDTYHLKEPYVPYPAYTRILSALEKCKTWAQPHIFLPNMTDPTEPVCETAVPSVASDRILVKGHTMTLHPLPSHSIASPELHDPVVETVWKALITAHSYCYPFFKDYYNDHHTFTVAIMPFFTNQVQKMWFLTGNSSSSGATANYTTQNIWYGNMLGDTGKLFEGIDSCYAAARTASMDGYPWYLNRPSLDKSNERRRRKRTADDEDIDDQEVDVIDETITVEGIDSNNQADSQVRYFNYDTGEISPNPDIKQSTDSEKPEKVGKEATCDD